MGHHFEESPDFLEGANAYVARQAFVNRSMEDHCVRLWALLDGWVSNGQSGSSSSPTFDVWSETLSSPMLEHV